jgi:hypothetical protein
MSCERHATALSDHAIGAPLDRAAQAHLDDCAACRARLDRDRQAMAMLDDDLAGALAVEPSADFRAQVRTRIASEPVPARFWPRALILAAATSLVIVVGLLALQSTRRASGPEGTPPHPDIALHSEAPQAPVAIVTRKAPMPELVHEPARGRRRQVDVQRVATRHSAEPAVIVPPDRAAAIRRYVMAVAEGRVEIPEGALPTPASAAPEIAPLTVEPIVIPPSESVTSKTTDPGF